VIAYLASGGSLVRGVLGGVVFAAAVSGWLVLRRRLWRD
jgi:hypothetical protein